MRPRVIILEHKHRIAMGWWLLLLLLAAPAAAEDPVYPSPVDLAVTPDGKTLAVAGSGSDALLLFDLPSGRYRTQIPVGRYPAAITLDQRGRLAYVANRDDDSVAVVDLDRQQAVSTLPAGWAPEDLILDPSGRFCFVANGLSNDVSVIDLDRGQEVKRLRAGEHPRALTLSADGSLLYVASLLSHPQPPDRAPVPEVTVIDLTRQAVTARIPLPGANLVYGIAAAPDGSVLVPVLRPKNLVPLIQVAGGWTITNGVAYLPASRLEASAGALSAWSDGQPQTPAVQLLVDRVNRHFADPTAIVVDSQGRYGYLTAGGSDRLVVLDLAAMRQIVTNAGPATRAHLAERLDLAERYVVAEIPTGANPVAVTLSPDGGSAYVANRLGDSVTVVNTATRTMEATLSLPGPSELTAWRRGERLFYSAAPTFNGQFSCASCHPDGAHDGLIYDISPDGLGRNFVDTRTLLGVRGTAPFKWSGLNPDLHTQCGPRSAMFIARSPGFSPTELDDVVAFMLYLPLSPNRYQASHGHLTPLQEWGKTIFERKADNIGQRIPAANRCSFCHSGPRFSNNRAFDVGTRSETDDSGLIDTPPLNNLAETAPYLHDGRALTLEELWTRFNPDDRHGRANDLSKEELNALIEYLKTL
jgi:YVTN family beta-propeller protein